MPGFWSFDWLFGRMKTGLFGEDLYGPEDGQFMGFGSYPHSRNRNRVLSNKEVNALHRGMTQEERQARLDGRMRVAQANYEMKMYKNGNRNKIYPLKN